jgi:hypothetical protein
MRIVLDTPVKVAAAKRAIEAAGPGMEVVIRRHVPDDRVDPMRRYLFQVVYPAIASRILETSGKIFGVPDIHGMMMKRFLAPYIRQGTSGEGEGDLVYTTKGLTNKPMGEFVEKVTWYAADRLECTIPPRQDE